jgi:hypothetical protein
LAELDELELLLLDALLLELSDISSNSMAA